MTGMGVGRVRLTYEWRAGIGPLIRLGVGDSRFALCLCHHLPERSVPFFGLERYLCSRCLGLLLGGVTGLVLRHGGLHLPVPIAAALVLPLVIDGVTQGLGWRSSTNGLRLATGLLCGAAMVVGGV